MSLNPLNPTWHPDFIDHRPDFSSVHPDLGSGASWANGGRAGPSMAIHWCQDCSRSTCRPIHGSIALRSGLHTPLYEVSATTLTPASVVSPGGDVSLG